MANEALQFIPFGWRRVAIGETIKEGDQYWSTSKKWLQTPISDVVAANPDVVFITEEKPNGQTSQEHQ